MQYVDKAIIYSYTILSDASCEALENIPNGSFSPAGGIYGDVVTYHCNEGYQLNGTDKRTCQSNRKWSGRAPTCVGRQSKGFAMSRSILKKFCNIMIKLYFCHNVSELVKKNCTLQQDNFITALKNASKFVNIQDVCQTIYRNILICFLKRDWKI